MRFVRFCRSLALLSEPYAVSAVAIPLFVAGCSSEAPPQGGGVSICNGDDCGTHPVEDSAYDGRCMGFCIDGSGIDTATQDAADAADAAPDGEDADEVDGEAGD